MTAARLIALSGVLLAIGLGGLGSGWAARAAVVERHAPEWDGHRWSEFSPAEKDAFLAGFLAGAAASQAYPVLLEDTVFDPGALEERLAALRSDGALTFPYAASLYRARLHDYYFYVDRRDRPIYRALAELNFQIQGMGY